MEINELDFKHIDLKTLGKLKKTFIGVFLFSNPSLNPSLNSMLGYSVESKER